MAPTIHTDKLRSFKEWRLSALGLGTYLGNYDDATDEATYRAILVAHALGVNHMDTAINYRCQRSERVVGRILEELGRNSFFISTKGGFLPFDKAPPHDIGDYIHKKWIHSGLVQDSDIVKNCHCLKPKFLEDQIQTSLDNLKTDTIDLYYLHNPEIEKGVSGPGFEDRLCLAFEWLEEKVRQRQIRYYGLATWTGFREPIGSGEALDLKKIVEIAKRSGGKNHHFAAIQLPYNLAQMEAIGVHSQSIDHEKKLPILSAAQHFGIHVFISAPLLQSRLAALSRSVLQKLPGPITPANKALQFVLSTPGVTATVCGMKDIAHVRENAVVLQMPNWDLKTLQKICDELVS